jgi:hypothetical protein
MLPSTAAILRYFEYAHLPRPLQDISEPFGLLARQMAERLEGPELTAGLRKLLEAKDCMVRAALDLGKAVPSSAGSGPRDFSAEVHSHVSGRGPS